MFFYYVDCNGQVRIVDSNYKQFGIVEVCINDTWRGICSTHWNDNEASVVCNQLGFSPKGSI